ncbi:MAG: hypothetical protein CMJ42_00905 [Phyllobacteriaceae bacterium]|nr:hypothetical protein [Phyllobacteriaceae bacterium]
MLSLSVFVADLADEFLNPASHTGSTVRKELHPFLPLHGPAAPPLRDRPAQSGLRRLAQGAAIFYEWTVTLGPLERRSGAG